MVECYRCDRCDSKPTAFTTRSEVFVSLIGGCGRQGVRIMENREVAIGARTIGEHTLPKSDGG
jgi:hypothetical protein